MKLYSIEFDEYEKAVLMTAIQNDERRLGSLWSRVNCADSKKVVPHPEEAIDPGQEKVSDLERARAEFHANALKTAPPPAPIPYHESESAKFKVEVDLERFNPPKPGRTYATKPCCGSNGPRHKNECPTKSNDVPDKPVEEDATPVTAEKEASEDEEDEDDEDEGTEDQEFICKECGNTRIEPHGTKALLLSCPNGWTENPEKHVYELKIED